LSPDWTWAEQHQVAENPIPHEGDLLQSPEALKGLMVHQAIARAGAMAWYCAIHLGEPEPEQRWQRLSPCLLEAQDIMAELRRLGTQDQVEAVLKKYPFVPVDSISDEPEQENSGKQ
jgi:hypothetical protein